jgi:hypothetical protein
MAPASLNLMVDESNFMSAPLFNEFSYVRVRCNFYILNNQFEKILTSKKR